MVILGVPDQLPAAIFGVVGAALTVGLKDLAGNFVENRLRGLVAAYPRSTATADSWQLRKNLTFVRVLKGHGFRAVPMNADEENPASAAGRTRKRTPGHRGRAALQRRVKVPT